MNNQTQYIRLCRTYLANPLVLANSLEKRDIMKYLRAFARRLTRQSCKHAPAALKALGPSGEVVYNRGCLCPWLCYAYPPFNALANQRLLPSSFRPACRQLAQLHQLNAYPSKLKLLSRGSFPHAHPPCCHAVLPRPGLQQAIPMTWRQLPID